MRRKLIKQDAFDQIISESATAAERELAQAAPILAGALDRDQLALRCFDGRTAVYETADDSFVHAGFEIKNGQIAFNNIEELVIDESSRKAKQRAIVSEMLDLIVSAEPTNDHKERADELFKQYLGMVRWDEAKGGFPFKKGKKKKGFPFKKDKDEDEDGDKKPFFFGKAKKAGKDVAEAYAVAHNVLDYCRLMKVGPTLAEAVSKSDDKGNVTDIKFPTVRERSEAKLRRCEWRDLNTKVADGRKVAQALPESQDFCKAVAHLRRQNKFSDPAALEEALDAIVKEVPQALYVTQSELAGLIGESLATAGVKNYGDEDCEFMAEAILRRAAQVYHEKAAQVLHLAGAPKMEEGADPHRWFQSVAEQFYPALDEKFGLEQRVFADLYQSAGAVFKKADRLGDSALKNEAASYATDLAAVLNGEVKPSLELAEETARWLATLIETNLENGKWNVSNTPHLTVSGDHPDMAKKAAHGYTPSKDFSGDWGDEAPAIGQDSMDYKSGKNARTMRNDSWGQAGDKADVFPKLKNPYTPKPFGDYTMKGEKGVDKSNTDWSMWKSKDTWPDLDNPYVPKEAGKKYKMKNGKETDLVVDR